MKKLLTYVIVTSFIMVLFPYTAFAAVPALSGSVENGVLTVTVSGVSSRTYPQVIVLSKNKDDESDFYLDTINLAKGQKTVKHTNVSGKTYILTAILKKKDGTDAEGTIYGVAESVSAVSASSSTSKNSASTKTNRSNESGTSYYMAPVSEVNGTNVSSPNKPDNSSKSSNAAHYYTDSEMFENSGSQNNSALPLIIMSVILIGTSIIFARKFSEKEK